MTRIETVDELLRALDERGDEVSVAAARLIRTVGAQAPDVLDIENAELDSDDEDGDYSVFSADNIRHEDDDHEGVKARLATGRAARVNNLTQLERDYARLAKDIARCAICNDDEKN